MTIPLTTERPSRAGLAPGQLPVGIVGLGVAVPDEVITNHDWEEALDTSDEWIRTRTGIVERRRIAEDDATSDLAVRAGVAALAEAGVDADELGAIIVATTTPDYVCPQTAPIVAAELGTNVAAFDVGAACSGFVYGLSVAAATVTAYDPRPILLIGAEAMTRLMDEEDRSTAVLFGDGAGACVLAANNGGGTLGPFEMGSDGDLADALIIPAGGSRNPASQETVAERQHYLTMSGSEIYKHAVTRMTSSARSVLERAGMDIDDIDLLVAHQANARILNAVADRLGVDEDRAFIDVDRYGNTSAASIPLALVDAREQGLLPAGATVLLTAFGAGLTWASCLVTFPDGDPEVTP